MLRPWPADDGALIRLHLAGGHLPAGSLESLAQIAHDHGDGQLHLMGRANLQLRALLLVDGRLPDEVADSVVRTGLLPSRSHELARNRKCSPLTGNSGGRADLRRVVRELDERLCASPALAALPAGSCSCSTTAGRPRRL